MALRAGGLPGIEVDGKGGAVDPAPALACGEVSASSGVTSVMPKSASEETSSSAEG